jgi:hypothetical protein
MTQATATTVDAVLLLLLRIAALAIAVMGLMASFGLLYMGDSEGVTSTDVGVAIAAVVAVELLAVVVWLCAPRLARRFVVADVDGTRATDIAAPAFALLGLWFVGSGVADLVTAPVQMWVSRALGAPSEALDAIGRALGVSFIATELVRIAFGAALLLKSRALAAWLAGRAAP